MLEISERAMELADSTIALSKDAAILKINTDADYQAAGTKLKMISELTRVITDERMTITRPIDEAKKAVIDFFRVPLHRLVGATTLLKRALLTYEDKIERDRRAEEARLRDLQFKEKERMRKKAIQAVQVGKQEKAAELREQAENIPLPVVADTSPKVKGVATKVTWHAEVENLATLIKAVADGGLPSELLLPNMPALNGVARSLRGAMKYPGVKAVSTKGIAA